MSKGRKRILSFISAFFSVISSRSILLRNKVIWKTARVSDTVLDRSILAIITFTHKQRCGSFYSPVDANAMTSAIIRGKRSLTSYCSLEKQQNVSINLLLPITNIYNIV